MSETVPQDQQQPTGDPHGGALPPGTFQIVLMNPRIFVMDVTMPGPDGQPVQHKVIKAADRANPFMQIDLPMPLDLAEQVADQLGKRPSGIYRAPAGLDLSKLREQGA